MDQRIAALANMDVPILPDDGDDSHVFRGAALGNPLDPNDPVDPLYEYVMADWYMVGDREYPPFYYHALSKYRAHPDDQARMRRAISGLPRVNPKDYEILFNGFIRCWEIVKWVPEPSAPRWIPGLGEVIMVIRMPLDVHTMEYGRNPESLGERDWMWLRRNCVTNRDPGLIDEEILAYNEEIKRNRETRRQDAEYDAAHYYHKGIRREAEEAGILHATPQELAEKLGGEPWMYDPDYGLEEF